jgi:hypothetical protein
MITIADTSSRPRRAAKSWTVKSRPHQRPALFVAHAVASDTALVIAAAGGVAELGAIAMVALFVPGAMSAHFLLIPARLPELPS